MKIKKILLSSCAVVSLLSISSSAFAAGIDGKEIVQCPDPANTDGC
ncbi:hypothetical protein [Brevibacillus daliensis]|nr:hypothetical protein [Brevibacillus daliensis]